MGANRLDRVNGALDRGGGIRLGDSPTRGGNGGQALTAAPPPPTDPWEDGAQATLVGNPEPDMHAMTAPQILGYEFLWATSRVAKFIFYTDVPTRSTTEYTPQGGGPMRTHTDELVSTTEEYLHEYSNSPHA